jgi:hypothetical protein
MLTASVMEKQEESIKKRFSKYSLKLAEKFNSSTILRAMHLSRSEGLDRLPAEGEQSSARVADIEAHQTQTSEANVPNKETYSSSINGPTVYDEELMDLRLTVFVNFTCVTVLMLVGAGIMSEIEDWDYSDSFYWVRKYINILMT